MLTLRTTHAHFKSHEIFHARAHTMQFGPDGIRKAVPFRFFVLLVYTPTPTINRTLPYQNEMLELISYCVSLGVPEHITLERVCSEIPEFRMISPIPGNTKNIHPRRGGPRTNETPPYIYIYTVYIYIYMVVFFLMLV